MSDRTQDPETVADHVVNTVRAQTGGKRLPETIDETHLLVVLAANSGYDHRLVREALQVAVEQGRLRETDGEYIFAKDDTTIYSLSRMFITGFIHSIYR